MKANEFVKKHSLQYTRNLVRDYPNHTHVTDDGRMFINENTCAEHIKVQLNELVKMDDLKRLVESHELVDRYENIDDAKNHLGKIRLSIATKTWFGRALLNWSLYADNMEQAIADVESCL